jgi:hypothetical protein
MSRWLRHGSCYEADVVSGAANRYGHITIDEQPWVPVDELTTLVVDYLKRQAGPREAEE